MILDQNSTHLITMLYDTSSVMQNTINEIIHEYRNELNVNKYGVKLVDKVLEHNLQNGFSNLNISLSKSYIENQKPNSDSSDKIAN